MEPTQRNIFIVSRPFLGHTSGTGEQYVANAFYATLIKKYRASIVHGFLGIPPYHSTASMVAYDWLAPLAVLLFCKIKGIRLALFVSPYQSLYVGLFKLCKVRTILIVHDCFFLQYRCASPFDKYSYSLYWNGLRYADHVLTSTEENKEQLERVFSRKSIVLPYHLDDTFGIEFIQKKFAKEFGYIGKYDNFRKRVFHIAEFLERTRHPVRFHLAWHITEAFSQTLSTIKNDKITLHTLWPIPLSEKIDFYRGINFLFFPTDLEWFWLPLLEALRTSVIPIVFQDANIPKIIKDACIQIGSISDLDDVIDTFGNDPDRYASTIFQNYEFSLRFDEKNLLDFIGEASREGKNESQDM